MTISFGKLRGRILVVLAIFAALQGILASDLESIICLIEIFVTTAIVNSLVLRRDVLANFTLSAVMVWGFSTVNLALPLIAKTFEFSPVTEFLELPLRTYTYASLTTLTLAFAHLAYRTVAPLQNLRMSLVKRYVGPLGAFKPPTTTQIWLMGLVGLFALYNKTNLAYQGGDSNEGVSGRFIEGLLPFAYAPFILALRFLYERGRKLTRIEIVALGVFFLIILGLAVSRGSRTTFVQPFIALFLGYMVGVVTERLSLKSINRRIVLAWGLAIGIGFPLVSALAFAMQISRGSKADFGASELISRTIEVASDTERQEQLAQVLQERTDWNEHYVDNLFLSRMITTKFHDSSLVLVDQLPQENYGTFARYALLRTFYFLPRPLFQLLPFEETKTDIEARGTFADEMYFLATGSDVHGHKVGSLIATGLVVFDVLFFPVMLLFSMFLFPFVDCLALPARRLSQLIAVNKLPVWTAEEAQDWRPVLSVVAVLNLVLILLNALIVDSVTEFLSICLRDVPQMVLLYTVVYYVTAKLSFGINQRVESVKAASSARTGRWSSPSAGP